MQLVAGNIRELDEKSIAREAGAASSVCASWIGATLRYIFVNRPSAEPKPVSGEAHARESESPSIGGYMPKTDLGRKLLALRTQYAAKGGKFLNREELDEEVARRKGIRG